MTTLGTRARTMSAILATAMTLACTSAGAPSSSAVVATPSSVASSPSGPAPSASGPPPSPSAGCGTSAVRAVTVHDSMRVNGLERTWYVHVPAAHDGVTPLPLVVQFHGLGNDVTDMAATGLDALGDQQGFVVLTPVGRGAQPRWLFELDSPGLDVTIANPDIAFAGALLDRLEGELCLDTSRIFATGISNGAFMTSALPCALGDRIAAIAPVAGVVDFGAACHPARAVPVIAFHGDADTVLPLAGGFAPELLAEVLPETGRPFGDLPMVGDPVWSVPLRDRMAGIAARNGCQAEPTSTPLGDTDRLAWSCPPGADVQFFVVHGGWHDWPPQATQAIWDFFSRHPLVSR